jgi:hypothetical protein
MLTVALQWMRGELGLREAANAWHESNAGSERSRAIGRVSPRSISEADAHHPFLLGKGTPNNVVDKES